MGKWVLVNLTTPNKTIPRLFTCVFAEIHLFAKWLLFKSLIYLSPFCSTTFSPWLSLKGKDLDISFCTQLSDDWDAQRTTVVWDNSELCEVIYYKGIRTQPAACAQHKGKWVFDSSPVLLSGDSAKWNHPGSTHTLGSEFSIAAVSTNQMN